jgi:hypothetical protein
MLEATVEYLIELNDATVANSDRSFTDPRISHAKMSVALNLLARQIGASS